nr:MAG TPA: hypothetical protein [Caudoviricetes sp.]
MIGSYGCDDYDRSRARYETCKKRKEKHIGEYDGIEVKGILNCPDYIPKSNGGKNNG